MRQARALVGVRSRARASTVLAAMLVCLAAPSRGQVPAGDTTRTTGDTLRAASQYRYPPHLGPSDRTYWAVASGSLVVGILLDRTALPVIRGYRTPFLDRVAPLGDVFGTANYTVPTITAALIAAQLSHNVEWEDATRHITLSYILADVTEALLKGGVGRQRPGFSGNPWVFKPLSVSGQYQSFPSGHVTHITAIAAALAEEADRPWVTALSTGAVVLTAWQRLYRNQHWSSDVVGGMIIGTAASRVTAHWLRHHRQRRPGSS